METTTEGIWKASSDRLRGFLAKRIADPDDAEDILQEIFIKVHTRLHTLRDKSRLAHWLYQIARNSLIDHYRRRTLSSALPEDLASAVEPVQNEAESQIAAYLLALVDSLPEGYRQAVALYELEGLKQDEIGRRLGLSHSGAKSRVQRGRELLKKALLDCCHFEFDRTGRIIDYNERQECCARHHRCSR